MGRALLAARFENDLCYASSNSCLGISIYVSASISLPRHVFHSGVIFFQAMNLLIYSDSSANYGPKSVGGSEGIAFEIGG